ncbi:SDR family NAD(P)-dependent oxidoreductase [Pararobbsia silviterrae]|uniref:SDR family oxidoreductase n=1 Tax=Pararobbsia silviterrae TaxID=1792498 RepID=A0A494Y9B2_9BURK|nr:SDR family oxidoreductase [Pararobbsia silviterrae]RKP59292.1 SDR family oxidoreductase [Pararobbsia silviterrae]
MNEFSGASVAIAGANVGVGPAVVKAFAAQGARVVAGRLNVAGDPSHAELDGATRTVALDLLDRVSVAAFLDACAPIPGEPASSLSTLILVPPPVTTQAALDIGADVYRQTIDAELIGPILCIQEAARRMQAARKGGRIVSFVSMSGKTGVHRRVAPYAAAKGGLIAFSRVLAAELAPTSITVNVIATALFDVQVAAMHDPAEAIKGIPVGRPGRAEEAARAALYLASADAGYVTGETLNLSGGRFMD